MSLEGMKTMSDNIKLSGDVEQNVESMSGDIKIKGNFLRGTAKTMSGDIKISGDNAGSIGTMSGDVKVENNTGKIRTTSGDIELEQNLGNISSASGDVEAVSNSGSIQTTSGDIELEENTGKIMTTAGSITIGDIEITIEKVGVSINNADGVFSGRTQSIVSGGNVVISSGGANVSIINGKTFINGREVSGNGEGEVHKIHINNLTVDFLKKEFYVKGDKTSIEDLNSSSEGEVCVEGETILIHDRGQVIRLYSDKIDVEGQSDL